MVNSVAGSFCLILQGKRFDPDMPQTLRLEFARSNTKVSNKQKQKHQHQQLHHQQASLSSHHLLLQHQQQQQQLTLGRTLVHPLAARTPPICVVLYLCLLITTRNQ